MFFILDCNARKVGQRWTDLPKPKLNQIQIMFAVGFVVDFLLIYFIQEKVCDHGGLAASISFFTKLNSVFLRRI